VENELYDRSRQEYSLGNRVPSVAADAWIAPNATLIGDTDVADQCSVWHGAVLKGDLGPVRLGAFSNVQERCVIDAAGCVE
jgi:carbonic anhydrase/acetyltransferase-like protein (isoleucine patch superfamily)